MLKYNYMSERKILYHYTTIAKAIKYILPTKQLRLGKLNKTNDPRENKGLVFSHILEKNDTSKTHYDVFTQNDEVNKKLLSGCKFFSFSTDSDLFKGYQLSSMWAHYGGNHKGVCLEFDYEKFLEENKHLNEDNFRCITYKKPTNYNTENISIKSNEILNDKIEFDKFREKYKKELFFTKTIEWINEQEKRLLHFSDSPDYEFCKIEKSLTTVFLGIDCNHKYYKPRIKKLLCNDDIKLWKLDYHQDSEKLELTGKSFI